MKTLLDWFRDRRSRAIVRLMKDHLIKVLDTNHGLIEAIRTSLVTPVDKEKVFASIEAVHLNEKAGDSILLDLSELISGALFLPTRHIMYRLVRSNDSIANWHHAASKNLQLALDLGFSLPLNTLKIEETMLQLTEQSIIKVREAIEMLAEDAEKALDICKEIESIESKVDELFFEARRELLSVELSPAALITQLDLLLGIEQASDYCTKSVDSIIDIVMTGR